MQSKGRINFIDGSGDTINEVVFYSKDHFMFTTCEGIFVYNLNFDTDIKVKRLDTSFAKVKVRGNGDSYLSYDDCLFTCAGVKNIQLTNVDTVLQKELEYAGTHYN